MAVAKRTLSTKNMVIEERLAHRAVELAEALLAASRRAKGRASLEDLCVIGYDVYLVRATPSPP